MTAHTSVQREFIALQLARFAQPTTIIDAFRRKWPDTHCDGDDVQRCNPDQGGLLSPELDAKFRAERQRIIDDPFNHPAAYKNVRLAIIGGVLDEACARSVTATIFKAIEAVRAETAGDDEEIGDLPAKRKVRSVNFHIVDPAGA